MELKETTKEICSNAEQFLDDNRRLEDESADAEELMEDNVAMANQIVELQEEMQEMKNEYIRNLTTLMNETEGHGDV